MLKTKTRNHAVVALACALLVAATATSVAHGQSGGMAPPGSVSPAPAPSATTSSSWTVYKKATWYGPGFWGNDTACGIVLQPTTIGTAHKKLPCGTLVTFSHAGRSVTATVIDRGPYRKGYAWDLTKKTAKRVGFLETGSGKITATVTPPAP